MDIIHLDEHIIVINKHAGLSVLPEGWEPNAPYLLKILEEKHGKIFVVHRLDKVTSGVMVFARTADAHRELNRQFERHEVEKVYQAIVEGLPTWDVKVYQAIVEGLPAWDEKVCKMPVRVNVGHKHRTAIDHKRGKPAETIFKVIKRGQTWALLEAHPQTGRTHQIRAHLSALGFPLLGDVLYGASETDLIARPALHATMLTINNPVSGQQMTFTASPPDDFLQAMEQLKHS